MAPNRCLPARIRPQTLALCRAEGKEILISTMESRLANVEALDAEIEAWTSKLSRENIVFRCQEVGIPCGPVNELNELINNPHLKARALLKPLIHPTLGQIPNAKAADFQVRFSNIDTGVDTPAPMLGQHTVEILTKTH